MSHLVKKTCAKNSWSKVESNASPLKNNITKLASPGERILRCSLSPVQFQSFTETSLVFFVLPQRRVRKGLVHKTCHLSFFSWKTKQNKRIKDRKKINQERIIFISFTFWIFHIQIQILDNLLNNEQFASKLLNSDNSSATVSNYETKSSIFLHSISVLHF